MLKGDSTCIGDGRCFLNSKDMTIEMCKEYCLKNGWALAGVENSDECFCGNHTPTKNLENSSCNYACRGDSQQICGGHWTINIYKLLGE